MIAEKKCSWDDAERWYRQCFTMEARLLGKEGDGCGLVQSLLNLGIVGAIHCSFETAERLYPQCLEMSQQRYGESVENLKLVAFWNLSGSITARKVPVDDAEQWHKNSLKSRSAFTTRM